MLLLSHILRRTLRVINILHTLSGHVKRIPYTYTNHVTCALASEIRGASPVQLTVCRWRDLANSNIWFALIKVVAILAFIAVGAGLIFGIDPRHSIGFSNLARARRVLATVLDRRLADAYSCLDELHGRSSFCCVRMVYHQNHLDILSSGV